MGRLYAANRIRELRKARKITQEAIAEGLGGTTTKGTIAKLENRAMALSLDYIIGIAGVLGVDPAEIIAPLNQRSQLVPVIALGEAADWRGAVAETDDVIAVPHHVYSRDVYAIRVAGDDIDKRVADGGTILVNPHDLDLEAGKLYVVSNGRGETAVRCFQAVPPRLVPCSTNPVHQPIDIGREPFLVLGRVVFEMQQL